MPIHDVGYRGWDRRKTMRPTRPLAIARSGITLVLRMKWLRFLLIFGWLPVALPAATIFLFEYAAREDPEQAAVMLMSPLIDRPDLAALFTTDPLTVRYEVWSSAILTFFRYPQLFAMVVLVGLITPRLVSYDLRSRAYLMYFARPLSPMEYVLGKSAVVWFFLGAIVTVPALLLYVSAVMLSPSFDVVSQTYDLPLRILIASVVLLVPTTTLAMAYSSFTTESRYATFAWFATWVMGFVAYNLLTFAPFMNPESQNRRQRGPVDMTTVEQWADTDRWRLCSPYHTLGRVQEWVFGLSPTDAAVWPAVSMLVAVTVIGTWVVRSRIRARLRV